MLYAKYPELLNHVSYANGAVVVGGKEYTPHDGRGILMAVLARLADISFTSKLEKANREFSFLILKTRVTVYIAPGLEVFVREANLPELKVRSLTEFSRYLRDRTSEILFDDLRGLATFRINEACQVVIGPFDTLERGLTAMQVRKFLWEEWVPGLLLQKMREIKSECTRVSEYEITWPGADAPVRIVPEQEQIVADQTYSVNAFLDTFGGITERERWFQEASAQLIPGHMALRSHHLHSTATLTIPHAGYERKLTVNPQLRRHVAEAIASYMETRGLLGFDPPTEEDPLANYTEMRRLLGFDPPLMGTDKLLQRLAALLGGTTNLNELLERACLTIEKLQEEVKCANSKRVCECKAAYGDPKSSPA